MARVTSEAKVETTVFVTVTIECTGDEANALAAVLDDKIVWVETEVGDLLCDLHDALMATDA